MIPQARMVAHANSARRSSVRFLPLRPLLHHCASWSRDRKIVLNADDCSRIIRPGCRLSNLVRLLDKGYPAGTSPTADSFDRGGIVMLDRTC